MNIYQHFFFIIPIVSLLLLGCFCLSLVFKSGGGFISDLIGVLSLITGLGFAVSYALSTGIPVLIKFYNTLGGL